MGWVTEECSQAHPLPGTAFRAGGSERCGQGRAPGRAEGRRRPASGPALCWAPEKLPHVTPGTSRSLRRRSRYSTRARRQAAREDGGPPLLASREAAPKGPRAQARLERQAGPLQPCCTSLGLTHAGPAPLTFVLKRPSLPTTLSIPKAVEQKDGLTKKNRVCEQRFSKCLNT